MKSNHYDITRCMKSVLEDTASKQVVLNIHGWEILAIYTLKDVLLVFQLFVTNTVIWNLLIFDTQVWG